MSQGNRGTFCDTCFSHFHDENEHFLQNHLQRKNGIQTLLNNSREAYLIHHHIHKKIETSHNYENVVQPCEECNWRSSSWRCIDCKQVS
jgi:hypothetical protein